LERENNKKNSLPSYLLILLLLSCARGEALAALSRQELQEARTLTTMTTVSVLLYYNLNGAPYEAENLEAFSHNLNRLRELSMQPAMPRSPTRSACSTMRLPSSSSCRRAPPMCARRGPPIHAGCRVSSRRITAWRNR
jgi:hypothetical protein